MAGNYSLKGKAFTVNRLPSLALICVTRPICYKIYPASLFMLRCAMVLVLLKVTKSASKLDACLHVCVSVYANMHCFYTSLSQGADMQISAALLKCFSKCRRTDYPDDDQEHDA